MKEISGNTIETLLKECLPGANSPFGLWIDKLFELCQRDDEVGTFILSKRLDIFLQLLECLLRRGQVLLTPPPLIEEKESYYWVIADGYTLHKPARPVERTSEDESNRCRVWDVPIEKQITYIRDAIPKNATDPDDIDLCAFWYDGRCPGIGWIHPETGVLWVS